jgi:peptidoglycan L-alanyl-D-glutamate endopeptidase CwlK
MPRSTAAPTSSEAKASEWQADPRSERNIATLEPVTAKLAREHLRRLAAEGYTFKVTSATRTFSEQAALYAKGRTAPGPKVTNARPGSSWHNFGLAYDLTLFQGDKNPVWDHPAYDLAGRIGKELGLRWGGDFKSIVDRPHFERPIGLSLAEARQKYPLGRVA